MALLGLLAACDKLFSVEQVPPVDVRTFDPTTECPGYDLQLFAGSRYRVIESLGFAWQAFDDCRDDVAGFTHLVVMSSRAELEAIRQSLELRNIRRWWIGAVQPVDVTQVDTAWIWATGAPVDPTFWATAPYDEPNDYNAGEVDHAEQFSAVALNYDGMVDYAGRVIDQAVCECDGEPVATAAAIAVDQSRL